MGDQRVVVCNLLQPWALAHDEASYRVPLITVIAARGRSNGGGGGNLQKSTHLLNTDHIVCVSAPDGRMDAMVEMVGGILFYLEDFSYHKLKELSDESYRRPSFPSRKRTKS